MRNHLIIGLGGTGGRAIRALRKRIMLEHRSEDIPIPGSGDKNFAIKYLYVDSSDEMMKPSDKSWRVLGQSVQLPPASQLLITGASIREVLANPQTHPTIQPWLGSAEQWANVPAQVIDGGAGGQRRRLGRFLFAMKAPEFKERVGRLLGELRSQTQQSDVHVHIITGLAGGTGGGSFLDVLTHMTRNPAIVGGSRISLFAVLPERGSTWSTGNYYANGYAALRELNGLMVGKYRPYDLMSAGERVEFDQTRIKGVYLITNENESTALKVDTDVPVMVSDFLYERLLESEQGQPPLASFENSPFGNECVPETEDAQRSRRFFSFGIKRVEYPEGEIEEFLAASLAKAAGLFNANQIALYARM